MLCAIAQVDEATSKDIDDVQQWSGRSNMFQKMKNVLHEWIIREDVIGGYIFGGGTNRKKFNRGKEELEVYNVLISY